MAQIRPIYLYYPLLCIIYIYTILDYNYINIINHAVIIYNIYIYLLRWCYIETSGCCAHPKRSLEVAATAAALEMGREAIHFFAVEQWMGQKLWFHGRNIWIICANIWGKPIHHRYIYIYIWIICVNNMDNMNMDTKKPPKIWSYTLQTLMSWSYTANIDRGPYGYTSINPTHPHVTGSSGDWPKKTFFWTLAITITVKIIIVEIK